MAEDGGVILLNTPPQKPVRGTQIDKTHPLSRGMIAAWPFYERDGLLIFDTSGNECIGAAGSTPTWGPLGIYFPGTAGSVVEISAGDSLEIEGPVSFFCGMLPETGVSYANVLMCYNASDPWNGYGFAFFDYNKFAYWSSDNGSWVWSNEVLSVNNYVDVAVTVGGTTASFYFNGIFDSSDTTEETALFTGTKSMGAYPGGEEGNYKGYIRYMYVYNRCLTADEVKTIYREPFCMFGA